MGRGETISYTIDIGADITRARQAAEQLQNIFKKNFSESSNKNMFNLFLGLEKALDTLERKGSQKISSIADAKALEKAKKDVIDYFDAIEREGKKIGNLGGADFKRRLEGLGTQLADSAKAWKAFEDAQKSANKEAEGQNSAIQRKIDENKKLYQSLKELKVIQDSLGGKNGEVAVAKRNATRLETAYNKVTGEFLTSGKNAKKAKDEFENYVKQHNISFTESGAISTSTKSKAKMGYITDADLQVINQYLATVRKLDREIQEKEKAPRFDQSKLDAYKAKRDAEQAKLDTELKNRHLSLTPSGQIDRTSIDKNLVNSNDLAIIRQYIREVNNLDKLIAAEEKKPKFDQQAIDQKKAERDTVKSNFDNAVKTRGLSLTATGDIDNTSVQQNRQAVEDQISEAQRLGQAWKDAAKDQQEAQKKMAEAQAQATKARTEADTKEATFKTNADQYNAYRNQLKQNREIIKEQREELKKFFDSTSQSNFNKLKESLLGIFGKEFVANMENSEEGLQKVKDKLDTIGDEKINDARNRILEFLKVFEEGEVADEAIGKLDNKIDSVRKHTEQLTATQRDVENFTNRFKHFFSLTNGFMLIRRAVKDAINTIKELDAVMTQTAVVSENTVADMWKTLPQYSEEAKKLGASIKDVYSAQTLYVQQGLNMNSAMDLGVETLKMARVAGIDAATATDSMTAALRGFKMELNEKSAQRVNDVYSKLAQNSASNVQEISTAMSKVASLASGANMSFENTASFLAKIIESTREGAETAGTALKTVIARFTEVKKLYSEGELLGTDEEGQEVDVNKISAALRTAGINMNEYFTGMKGLDDIYLELGAKWDSLTTIQQRYIATQAAGSRQQSRFIALMQNYNRTVELTQMAYNSAGSGQEQFEKTLDSLDSKINKIKDEWQSFIMGVTNSNVVKGFIDTGTVVLDIINKIINAISGGKGLIKSITSIALAFGLFKGGRALIKGTIGSSGSYGLGGMLGNWLGIKNNYSETQEKMAAFKASMRDGGLKGQRGEFLRNQWFGGSGVLNPKGRVEASKAAVAQAKAEAEAEVAARRKIYLREERELNQLRAERNADMEDTQQPPDPKSYQEIRFKAKEKDRDEAKANYEKSQEDLEKVGTNATDASTALYQYGQAVQVAGMAAGVAGGLCLTLASAIEKTGNTKAAESIRAIGTSLTLLSGVFMVLGQVAQITGMQIAAGAKTASTAIMNIPIIGWIAAIIAGLIALGVAIAAWVETPAERLARLSAETENAKQVAESAAQAYEDLFTTKNEYDKLVEQLSNLTAGTVEYKNALFEANEQIIELAKNYKDLKFTYDPKTGLLQVDEESYNKILERQLEIKKSTAATANLIQNREDKERIGQEIDQLKKAYGLKKSFTYEEDNEQYWKYSTLIDNLTDKEILALSKMAITTNDLQQMYAKAEEEIKGKGTNINTKEGIQDIQNLYTQNLKDKLSNVVATMEDPYNKLNSNIQNSLYEMSDQEKESSYTLSKLYTSSTFKNMVNPGNDRKDWKEKDWRQIAIDTEGNVIKDANGNAKTYWKDIIDTALGEGLLDDVQASSLKSTPVNSNDANYELYAAITGKELKDVKSMPIQEVVNYIGDYYQSSKMAEKFNIDQAKFEELDQNTQDAFSNLVNKPTELTYAQIQQLTNEWDKIKEIGFDEEKLTEYQNLKDKIEEDFNNIGSIEETNKKYLTQKAQRKRTQLEGFGDEYQEQYDSLFNKIGNSNFTDAQKNVIFSMLNTTNIRSLKDLYKVIGDLKDVGIDLESVDKVLYNQYIEFIKKLEQAGIATNKWTEETAKETVKSLRGTANDKKESQDRKFTKEQYEEIEKAFTGTDSQKYLKYFLEQTDGSYKYVGESLSDIISALYLIADSINKDRVKEAEVKAGLSSKIYNKRQKAKERYEKAEAAVDAIDTDTMTQDQINNIYKERQEAKEEYLKLEPSSLLFEGNGEKLTKTQVENKYTTETDQIKAYNTAIKKLLENEFTQEEIMAAGLDITATEDTIATLWATLLQIIFDPEGLNEQAQALKEKLDIIGQEDPGELANMADKRGKYEDISDSNQEVAQGALDTMMQETDMAEAYYYNIQQQAEAVDVLEKADNLYKALAIDCAKYNASLKTLNQSLTEAIKNYKSAKDKGKDLTESISQIRAALKKFYGPDFKISNQEIIDNIGLFEKMLKGGKEGAEAGRKFGEQYLEGIYKSITEAGNEEITEQIKNLVEGVNEENPLGEISIKIPIDGSVDAQGLYNALNGAIDGLANYAGTLLAIRLSDNGDSIEVVGEYMGTGAGGGGGGGGGGGEFKNDYDKYYNIVEDINELIRIRNLLETNYKQLLESEAATGEKIYDNLKKQIDLLEERKKIVEDLANKRKEQIFDFVNDKENAKLTQYAWWNDEDQTIEIDWDLIDKVKDSELGKKIKEYISKLEDLQKKYDEQIEALEEIESDLQEIIKRGRDQYTSLEDKVRDALMQEISDKIDELTAANEGINTANQNLLDNIQKALEKQRQERENAKTEEELADKEEKLQYLLQDSSNANALEIAKLQEELEDERQNYTDTLIDQKISELQEQNDLAAEQRQEQIDLLQQSLDWQEKNGEFWDQVYYIIDSGMGPNGTLITGSRLEELLKRKDEWNSLSEEQKTVWAGELIKQMAEATAYLAMARQLEDIGTKAGTTISFTNADGQLLTGVVDQNGNVVVTDADGNTLTYQNVFQDYNGSYRTFETEEQVRESEKPDGDSGSSSGDSGGDHSGGTYTSTKTYGAFSATASSDVSQAEADRLAYNAAVDKYIARENESLVKAEGELAEAQAQLARLKKNYEYAAHYGANATQLAAIQKDIDSASVAVSGLQRTVAGHKQLINTAKATKYKTGGLNTKTGLAWLDGTPSHPELVLNARDTENFIQLKDTLADLKKYGTSSGINGGDNYYEISINVDEIGSDYDVDRLADRLKTLIYKDGQYRNVNVLNRLR